ncbi:unnamed protein product [Ilex paraguariensis]|uniref:RHOMBOID-like protein n=1 Tax=Ilex paraguariensis TaxID=185542 RepID=A0ABC8RIS4_9AQUA
MGRTPAHSSPESNLEIKIQSRLSDPHPLGPQPPRSRHHHHHPPPRDFHLFKKWFPWLVPTIVVVNIGLFVMAMYINDCPRTSQSCLGAHILGRFAFQNTTENPLLGPSAATLLKIGALQAEKVVKGHQAWRLVTCMWLHAGVFHVLANMLSLLFVGIRLEKEFGFAVGILPHVDNFAHLGGFASGFLLGFVLLVRPHFGWVNQRNAPPGYFGTSTKSKYKIYQYILLGLSLILLIIGFTFGLVLLLRGVDGNEHCSWCHYLSCVPTPLWNCDKQCTSIQYGNQLKLTCLQNHKSMNYVLANGNNTSEIQQLCSDLCN